MKSTNMEKTLIIHPDDRSTDFLSILYAQIPYKKILCGGVSQKELVRLIKAHDTIMMMGHGSPRGLFAMGKFPTNSGFVIDEKHVKYLREKECVFIWCYASDFVKKHNLSGFSTGMFISELSEAMFCGVKEATQEMVDESNEKFVTLFNEAVSKNEDKQKAYYEVMNEYARFALHNKVAEYNNARLMLFEEVEK